MKNIGIKNVWSILCQKAHIDSRTNLISLLDVLEQINIELKEKLPSNSKKPLLFPISTTFASYWQILPEYKNKQIDMIVKICSPDGDILGSSELKFKTEKDYHRTLVDFPQLPITTAGLYLFEVYIKYGKEEKKICTVPLVVNITKTMN